MRVASDTRHWFSVPHSSLMSISINIPTLRAKERNKDCTQHNTRVNGLTLLGPIHLLSFSTRVQILLTDKSYTLKLVIQLEPILSQGSRNQIPRVVVWLIYRYMLYLSRTLELEVEEYSEVLFIKKLHRATPYPYSLAPGSEWDLRLLREHR